jgi:hypothetical protein
MKGMPWDPLTRAWLWLLCLGGTSALVAALVSFGVSRPLAGSVVLCLAWLKARTILSRYLGLAVAPAWLRGFNTVLGLYALLLLGLYLIPELSG